VTVTATKHSTMGEFLEAELPWTLDFEWFSDGYGVHRLDDDRRAQVTLTTNGYGDHYEGVDVEIISKTGGPIVKKRLLFDSYLLPGGRADDRTDYPIGGNVTYYAWTSSMASRREWQWYIAVPPVRPRRC
jgi:hypothetical protein